MSEETQTVQSERKLVYVKEERQRGKLKEGIEKYSENIVSI